MNEGYHDEIAALKKQLRRTDMLTPRYVDILNEIGFRHLKDRRFRQAEFYFNKARDLSKSITYKYGEGECLRRKATCAWHRRKLADTQRLANMALRAYGNDLPGRIGKADSHIILAIVQREKERLDDALAELARAEQIITGIETDQAMITRAMLYNTRGTIHLYRNDYHDALRALRMSLATAEKLGDDMRRWHALSNIGVLFDEIGMYDIALQYLQRADRLTEANIHPRDRIPLRVNMAAMYARLGRMEEAREMFHALLPDVERLPDRKARGTAYLNLGSAHQRTSRSDLAVKYYNKALAEYRKAGFHSGMTQVLMSFGTMFMEGGRLPEARRKLKRALSMAQSLNDLRNIAATEILIGRLYIRENDPGNALQHFTTALNRIRRTGPRYLQAEAHEGLSDAHERLGDHRKSLMHHRRFHTLRQAMFDEQASARNKALLWQSDQNHHEALQPVNSAPLEAALSVANDLQKAAGDLDTLLARLEGSPIADDLKATLRTVCMRITRSARNQADELLRDHSDNEEIRAFRSRLTTLNPALRPSLVRICVLLRVNPNLTNNEIAIAVRLPKGTVKTYLHRIRRILGLKSHSHLGHYLAGL